jgi:hypothetical protein
MRNLKWIVLIIFGLLLMTIIPLSNIANAGLYPYVFGETNKFLGTSYENPPLFYLPVSWYDDRADIQYHIIMSLFYCEFNCSVESITASVFIVSPYEGEIDAFCILFSGGMFPIAVTSIIRISGNVAYNVEFPIFNCSSSIEEPIEIKTGYYCIGIFGYLPDDYKDYSGGTPFLGITYSVVDYYCYPNGIENTHVYVYHNTDTIDNLYPCFFSKEETFYVQCGEASPTIWCNCIVNTSEYIGISLYEDIINATGTHEYIFTSTGYNVYANYTGNATNGTSFDPNSTGVWLYLGAMLTLDNGQFFLLILIGLWSYFIYLFYKEKEVIFSFCIICCGLPLGIILSGVAYYNSYPFGYLISFILILISFLIPTYGMYQKNKKKK